MTPKFKIGDRVRVKTSHVATFSFKSLDSTRYHGVEKEITNIARFLNDTTAKIRYSLEGIAPLFKEDDLELATPVLLVSRVTITPHNKPDAP